MGTEYIQKKKDILKAIIETYQNHNTVGFINKQIANILSVSIPSMRIVGDDLIIEYKDITKRMLERCNEEKRF